MPLVRIDLSSDTPETLGPAIGDLVYQAMRDTINVPEHDKFQVITRHAPPMYSALISDFFFSYQHYN